MNAEHAGPALAPRWMWAAGLAVAAGAAIATAHGLYEVARAAGAPTPIAALYPLITDGLALVAYATTTRLDAAGRRYAWTIVVLAAGLSGLAQAAYLAGGVHAAPAWLGFGVGAWPALAAAVVAHLLYLLGIVGRPTARPAGRPLDPDIGRTWAASTAYTNGEPTLDEAVDAAYSERASPPSSSGTTPSAGSPPGAEGSAPARERARATARAHRDRHGALPSVSALAAAADVARGTAATALKELRAERPALHIIAADAPNRQDR